MGKGLQFLVIPAKLGFLLQNRGILNFDGSSGYAFALKYLTVTQFTYISVGNEKSALLPR